MGASLLRSSSHPPLQRVRYPSNYLFDSGKEGLPFARGARVVDLRAGDLEAIGYSLAARAESSMTSGYTMATFSTRRRCLSKRMFNCSISAAACLSVYSTRCGSFSSFRYRVKGLSASRSTHQSLGFTQYIKKLRATGQLIPPNPYKV